MAGATLYAGPPLTRGAPKGMHARRRAWWRWCTCPICFICFLLPAKPVGVDWWSRRATKVIDRQRRGWGGFGRQPGAGGDPGIRDGLSRRQGRERSASGAQESAYQSAQPLVRADPVRRPARYPDGQQSERALRGPVVGRKNYYGSGATWSGELTATLFARIHQEPAGPTLRRCRGIADSARRSSAASWPSIRATIGWPCRGWSANGSTGGAPTGD